MRANVGGDRGERAVIAPTAMGFDWCRLLRRWWLRVVAADQRFNCPSAMRSHQPGMF